MSGLLELVESDRGTIEKRGLRVFVHIYMQSIREWKREYKNLSCTSILSISSWVGISVGIVDIIDSNGGMWMRRYHRVCVSQEEECLPFVVRVLILQDPKLGVVKITGYSNQ